MLQLQLLRQNPDLIKGRLKRKNFREINLVDEIISLDEEIRQLKTKVEDAQKQVNSKSDLMPQLNKSGKNEEVNRIRSEVIILKLLLKQYKPELEQKEKELQDKM